MTKAGYPPGIPLFCRGKSQKLATFRLSEEESS